MRRTGNGQDIIDAHRGICDDDGLHSPYETLRGRDLRLCLLWHQELHGDGQQDQTTDCLQIWNGEQPYRRQRHHKAYEHRTPRTDEDGLSAQVRR